MSLGSRRHLVTIEHEIEPASDATGLDAKWNPYAKAWCEKITQAGSEVNEQQQQRTKSRVEWRTHWTPYLAGVSSKMRVIDPDGAVLPIASVDNVDGENRELRIICETVD